MTKEEVVQLQKRMNDLGFGPIGVDGQYGKNTEKAYRAYLDSLDHDTPTIIPKPEKKWWHSKAVVGSISTVIASVFAIAGVSIDSSFLSEMIIAGITLITGFISLYGTVTRDSAIEKQILPKKQKQEYKDPRGMFSDDY